MWRWIYAKGVTPISGGPPLLETAASLFKPVFRTAVVHVMNNMIEWHRRNAFQIYLKIQLNVIGMDRIPSNQSVKFPIKRTANDNTMSYLFVYDVQCGLWTANRQLYAHSIVWIRRFGKNKLCSTNYNSMFHRYTTQFQIPTINSFGFLIHLVHRADECYYFIHASVYARANIIRRMQNTF